MVAADQHMCQCDPDLRLADLIRTTQHAVRWKEKTGALWKWLYYSVGGVSAAATALAGVTILAQWFGPTVPGVIAIASSLLTTLASFFNFNAREVRVRVEKAELRRLLQSSLSLASEAEIRSMDKDELRRRVDPLWGSFCDQEKVSAEARART